MQPQDHYVTIVYKAEDYSSNNSYLPYTCHTLKVLPPMGVGPRRRQDQVGAKSPKLAFISIYSKPPPTYQNAANKKNYDVSIRFAIVTVIVFFVQHKAIVMNTWETNHVPLPKLIWSCRESLV